ncbi:Uma2 family endonuclease [Kitasatospora indigofera]|uniref:Uma2 family endonuclease n=1 Tax=Kitasatospora indigofera TaxID=67307 RepID=UPI003629CBC3
MGATSTAVPDRLVPPEGGFTADDLDRMPGLPPHTELIDGSLVLRSPQKYFRSPAVYLLEQGLRATAPPELRVLREMSVVLGRRDRPEPDLSVVRADAVTEEAEETGFPASAVVLAVEVVSPDSVERDRDTEPRKYAQAGIPHLRRVEKAEGRRPVVYVYELDPATDTYAVNGIHHDRLKVGVPFPVDIDLTEIDRF